MVLCGDKGAHVDIDPARPEAQGPAGPFPIRRIKGEAADIDGVGHYGKVPIPKEPLSRRGSTGQAVGGVF